MFARQRMPQEIKPGEEGVISTGNHGNQFSSDQHFSTTSFCFN